MEWSELSTIMLASTSQGVAVILSVVYIVIVNCTP